MLTRTFIEKVIYEKIVDTKKYRYVYDSSIGKIKRINIEYVGTTKCYDISNWQCVVILPYGRNV